MLLQGKFGLFGPCAKALRWRIVVRRFLLRGRSHLLHAVVEVSLFFTFSVNVPRHILLPVLIVMIGQRFVQCGYVPDGVAGSLPAPQYNHDRGVCSCNRFGRKVEEILQSECFLDWTLEISIPDHPQMLVPSSIPKLPLSPPVLGTPNLTDPFFDTSMYFDHWSAIESWVAATNSTNGAARDFLEH